MHSFSTEPNSGQIVGAVNFDGGGRIWCNITDTTYEELQIGMAMEMSFREVFYDYGIHNYFWKAIPTVVAAASVNDQVARFVQSVFACPTFRVYINHDPIGTQIGGAMKNVLAIAAGICDGMNMGLNPRAALITRGLTEMNRLGTRLGADPLTLSGLAGVGDLLLTCTGALSRNYTVGVQIGQGKKLDDIISEMRMVAEGVKTTRSVYNLSRKLGVDLPICNEVYYVLFENYPLEQTIQRLMNRSLKHELDGVL
ncbi:MAG: NAD(P)H-dependent glycerol-3-phosphate dehydrogenase [Desulfotignum sp.]